jgi:hypothetical protein
MEFIFLVITTILTLFVFGVDVFQKRQQYLNDPES